MKPRQTIVRAMAAAVTVAILAAPAIGCGLVASDSTRYFRLRVRISSSAQEAMVSVTDPRDLLGVKLVSTTGRIDKKGVTASDAWVRRERTVPATQGVISMTVDYAVDPASAQKGFKVRLRTREPAATDLTFSRVEPGGERSRRSAVAGGADGNVDEEFDLGACMAGAEPLRDTAARPLDGMPVLAFYYPWYETSDCWASPLLGDRPLRKYSSGDEHAVRAQIREARSAGIDGFICSWWGPDSSTDANFRMLLDVAASEGFTVCPYLETLTAGTEPGTSVGRSEDELHSWLAYLIGKYGGHRAFTRAGGKPLVPVWASDAVPLESWSRIFGWLRAEGFDATYLANFANSEPRLDTLDVFDGLHAYNVLNIVGTGADVGKLTETYETTGRAVRNYHMLGGGDPRIWAPSAMPGYDDTRIPERNGGAVLDRADGAFYRSTLEAAVASKPDALFITSWNEWWEHSYIEPSESYGNKYLEITKEYTHSK
ncbi:MAG: endo-1,3-alpha-glucanase family glycosylhydrolase [Candidatus Geothermincolia bacterium]